MNRREFLGRASALIGGISASCQFRPELVAASSSSVAPEAPARPQPSFGVITQVDRDSVSARTARVRTSKIKLANGYYPENFRVGEPFQLL